MLRRLAQQRPELFAGIKRQRLYQLLEDEQLAATIARNHPRNSSATKAVRCVETGRVFRSILEVAAHVYVHRRATTNPPPRAPMTELVPRPALDPADWQLSRLAIYHPRDLLDPGSPWVTIPRIGTVAAPNTWIQAELIPLTVKAIDSIPLLTGHRFTCQGQLFEITGGYTTQGSGSESPVVVSITCEQIHDAQEQPVFPPLMLTTTTETNDTK